MKASYLNILIVVVTLTASIISLFHILSSLRKNKYIEKNAKNKYYETIKYSSIFETLNTNESIKDEIVYKEINKININIKNYFDVITNSKCRSTIRIIVYNDQIPLVVTLNSQTNTKNAETTFKIKKNKLFEDEYMTLFYHKPKDVFIYNDINEFNEFLPVRTTKDLNEGWNDLFLSTMVLPIKKTTASNKNFIYGFLCIESSLSHAFDTPKPVNTGKEISNSLLPIFEMWTSKMILKSKDLQSNIEFNLVK